MISRRVPIADSPGPHPTGRPSVAKTAGSETRRTEGGAETHIGK